jgi:hypothetical protein
VSSVRAYAFNERVAATIEQEVLATQQLDEDQAEKERAEQGQKQRDLGMEALQLTLAELNQAINVSTLVREGVYVGIEQISTVCMIVQSLIFMAMSLLMWLGLITAIKQTSHRRH